ncbi:MAG: hypothetical protein JRN68_02595 [Nitrososphaerota archaeon]|jgi:carbonic anhydrase/acetyltransferase-like protein (isoleucine patch superfamily)|nr:hypothetical protein [Nitrososphaerota archaeon]
MPELVVFQTERDTLYPLSLSRPAHSLIYSYRPILSHLKRGLGISPSCFILPQRLKGYMESREVNSKVNDSSTIRDSLFVNGCVRPSIEVLKSIADLAPGTALVSDNRIVAARLDSHPCDTPPLIGELEKQNVKMISAPQSSLLTPWLLIASMEAKLEGRGVVKGDGVSVEPPVYFDTTAGPVLVAEGAILEAFTRIQGPAIIGRNCVIHSARINGHTYIGEMSKIGGEVEASIVSAYTNKAHFGYLGHSYVGEWVNVGAGAVTSDLKNTYGPIRVNSDGRRVDTGMTKLGAVLCDYSKVAIGALIYAGKNVGTASHVYGLVDEDVPPFVSYNNRDTSTVKELNLDSVVETAKRMKARRGLLLSKDEEFLIRSCFEETAKERLNP